MQENQLFTRAAALSYSALIGMGPLVAITILISGAYLKDDAETRIKETLLFIAPSLREYVTLENGAALSQSQALKSPSGQDTPAGDKPLPRSDLDEMISQIIAGSEKTFGQINTKGRSTAGLIGVFILIAIGIQLLTSIERTFNSIWGITRGREWGQRIVFYWTFITLGVLLGLGSTALLSASTLTGMFAWLPFGTTLTTLFVTLTPLISLLMLGLLLTFVYQFFPNTTVRFRPACIGGFSVALVLFLNNYLSILYVHQVIRMQSLYGSLGIILVMMIGLYSFWIFVLFGAQFTYAIQNVHYLTHREIWRGISASTQEAVTLAVWTQIARNFADCAPAPTASGLSERLRIPGNVLNSSLSILQESEWITVNRTTTRDGLEEISYRPSKPLQHFTLGHFHETFIHFGNAQGAAFVTDLDPVVGLYQSLDQVARHEESQIPFDALLTRFPGTSCPEPKDA